MLHDRRPGAVGRKQIVLELVPQVQHPVSVGRLTAESAGPAAGAERSTEAVRVGPVGAGCARVVDVDAGRVVQGDGQPRGGAAEQGAVAGADPIQEQRRVVAATQGGDELPAESRLEVEIDGHLRDVAERGSGDADDVLRTRRHEQPAAVRRRVLRPGRQARRDVDSPAVRRSARYSRRSRSRSPRRGPHHSPRRSRPSESTRPSRPAPRAGWRRRRACARRRLPRAGCSSAPDTAWRTRSLRRAGSARAGRRTGLESGAGRRGPTGRSGWTASPRECRPRR